MKSESSLTIRAFLAVFLFVGFYFLSLAIVGILLYISYYQVFILEKGIGRLIFFCIAGAGIILWSILPRRDKFIEPGPLLLREKHPGLFSKINDIAKISQQSIPKEVYLIPEANAWVSRRGGFMGFGSRRVMAIGFPLLRILTTNQLLAVLAHEFGHYHGGDVKLGPWIYKTRTALDRTIMGLQKHSSILQMPFVWYGRTFLRVTSTVSRRQEFAADKLASEIFGKRNMIEALKSLEKGAFIFNSFWANEIAPVLSKGFYPPLLEGFRMYLESEEVKEFMESNFEEDLDSSETEPYDSHPSLKERVKALDKMHEKKYPRDDSLALSLFNATEENFDEEIMSWLIEGEKTSLNPVSWKEVGQKVWPKIWEERAAAYYCDMVRQVVPLDFPKLIHDKKQFLGKELPVEPSMLTVDEQRKQASVIILGTILADAMIKQGWNVDVYPGADAVLKKGKIEFSPFQTVAQLVNGEISSDAWAEVCRKLGIESLSIGPSLLNL